MVYTEKNNDKIIIVNLSIKYKYQVVKKEKFKNLFKVCLKDHKKL